MIENDSTQAMSAPATEAPPNEAPADEAPTTEAPATEAPESEAAPARHGTSFKTAGDHSLVVARVESTEVATRIYVTLLDAELGGNIHIDGVLVIQADDNGQPKILKMVEHSTRNGLKWGAVAGVLAGAVFPMSIVAGAVGLGIAGAVRGKHKNVQRRRDLEAQIAPVITAGATGVLCLAATSDVPAIAQMMQPSLELKTLPVDPATAEALKAAAASAAK